MAIPAFPAQGSTNWYAWAQWIDADARNTLNARDYGAVGDGIADDSAALQAAFNAAGTARQAVAIPPGTYLLDNVGIPANVKVVGLGSAPYRFGSTGVTLKHKVFSTNPALVLNGGGDSLENITLDGNGATGTVLVVAHGFETRLRSVRVINGGGRGIEIRGAGNASYNDVFVDNCAGVGVLISSNTTQAINTLDMTGLHIERCGDTALQIGEVGDAIVPEFLRFTNLHIEAAADNGGTNNVGPVVHIKRSRSVHFINPYLYGGPGPLIQQEQFGVESDLGGVTVLGGTLLGKDAASGAQPERLIDLVTGDEFMITGTRLDKCQYGAIRINPTYGPRAFVLPGNMYTPRVGAPFEDNRTDTPFPLFMAGDTSILGHLVSQQSITRPTVAASPTGAPAPSMDQHTDNKGLVFFGSAAAPTAGPQVEVTYSRPYNSQPAVILTSGNADTAALDPFVESYSDGTGFRIHTRVAPAASQANGAYQVVYVVIG